MLSARSFGKKIVRPATFFVGFISIFILGFFLFYSVKYIGHIYPNTYVAGVNIGGLTPDAANSTLKNAVSPPNKINLVNQSQSFELNIKVIDVNYDINESVDRAYNLTRTGNFVADFVGRLQLLTGTKNLGLSVNIDETKLSSFISVVAGQVTVEPIYPSVEKTAGVIKINKGSPGTLVNSQLLRATIGKSLAFLDSSDITIPIETVDPTLSSEEIETTKIRAEKYLGKSILLKFESQDFNYKESEILKFINPVGGYNDEDLNKTITEIAKSVNRDPQNPKFEFNGAKVTEFLPALDGVVLDNQKLKELLIINLDKLAETEEKSIAFDIPVVRTKSDIATNEVNDLGIKELIGRGTSTYFHSIPGRVFNVNLAASRVNGTLVKPGDTFSFNEVLGDVSKLTGYKEAYIISGGKTILGDGGGVCQVSTTLFRAALNAGLPILERAAHAYRVGYYEQNSSPGMDATVYAPSPDFKFKNDTPGYILIQAKNNPKNYSLVFELYGTSDGRVATVSKPVVSNVRPAPETVYQDDPTLPMGTLKQTDFAAAGAKVVFNYSVMRGGEQIYKKTFTSNYQPWQAIYLRGTGPAI